MQILQCRARGFHVSIEDMHKACIFGRWTCSMSAEGPFPLDYKGEYNCSSIQGESYVLTISDLSKRFDIH